MLIRLFLIKLNETRKMMRNALGLNMNNSIEEVIDTYWTLGDFTVRRN